MQKFEFNLKSFVSLQKIPQAKIINYLDHLNYKLRGCYVIVHKMFLWNDTQSRVGKLVDMKNLDGKIYLHLKIDGFAVIQEVALTQNEIAVFFKSSDDVNFFPKFIYWDDKYPPLSYGILPLGGFDFKTGGINFKTLVGTISLSKEQLLKYLDHPNYMLRQRKAFTSFWSTIDVKMKKVILNEITPETLPDDKILVIMDDKEGLIPEFVYWND